MAVVTRARKQPSFEFWYMPGDVERYFNAKTYCQFALRRPIVALSLLTKHLTELKTSFPTILGVISSSRFLDMTVTTLKRSEPL